MVSNTSSFTLSNFYKEVTSPILMKILEKGSALIEKIKSDFSVEGQYVTFLCPENREKWTIVFISKRGLLGGKKEFYFPSIKKVTVTSVIPLRDITSKCVVLYPDKGFELIYKNLEERVPYILDVEFDIEHPRFIDNLVYRKVQDDTFQEYRRYWMQAQLKFVDALERRFSSIKFEDLDFDVRVSTHEDIRVSIPATFRRELEVVVEWLKETDRERKKRLTHEHLQILRSRGGGARRTDSILELLQKLQDIFLPKTFRTFLKVERDFRYHDCIRGLDYYSAPFPTWPKFMTVITRTNLDLDKPAAEGVLDFSYPDFRRKIEDIFRNYL